MKNKTTSLILMILTFLISDPLKASKRVINEDLEINPSWLLSLPKSFNDSIPYQLQPMEIVVDELPEEYDKVNNDRGEGLPYYDINLPFFEHKNAEQIHIHNNNPFKLEIIENDGKLLRTKSQIPIKLNKENLKKYIFESKPAEEYLEREEIIGGIEHRDGRTNIIETDKWPNIE